MASIAMSTVISATRSTPSTAWDHTHTSSMPVPTEDPCAQAWLEGETKANDDIVGIGVIVAFFATAWAAFFFLIMAYWLGLLPGELLRPLDRRLFRANSRRCHSDWKLTLDNVTLLFSDQQLLTGIAILLAGFYEVYKHDLDILHWHMVTYLAWMSSTVHLITLSLLRDRLNANKAMRNLRLAAMLIFLGLLVVALTPSASVCYVNITMLVAGLAGGAQDTPSIATPTKCFFGSGYTARWQPYRGTCPDGTQLTPVSPAAIVSYTMLMGSYLWKISQLLESSSNWWRTTMRHAPEAKLELAAKRALLRHQRPTWYDWCLYFVIKVAYLMFCMIADILDSFAMTNLALLSTLIWGTMQVTLPRIWLKQNFNPRDSPKEELSFGQILPLMLLLQPVAGIVAHFLGEKQAYHNIASCHQKLTRSR